MTSADTPEAWIVVDLGFGDAGKGTVTDFLVRNRGARLVVRFNGGPQAGHTVVAPDARVHTFAQLGAGSFCPGVRTHLAAPVAVHPGGLLEEVRRLEGLGVTDALARLTVDPRCTVITPFQQASNRLRELLRGADRHGSCGVGFGEAVADALTPQPDSLRAGELCDVGATLRKLRAQQERKRAELGPAAAELPGPQAHAERALLDDPGAPARALRQWRPLGSGLRLAAPNTLAMALNEGPAVVLEGAQGVLLDQTWGFAPHTTWSDCTFGGAESVLAEAGFSGRGLRLGVLRGYSVRHGAGPLPSEDPTWSASLPEPHNPWGPWQGAPRKGPLDLVLLRYALQVCGRVDGLALTCLDHLTKLPRPEVCAAYAIGEAVDPALAVLGADGALVERLCPGAASSLEHRAALAGLLAAVRPRRQPLPGPDGGVAALTRLLETEESLPVWLTSRGPQARDKSWR